MTTASNLSIYLYWKVCCYHRVEKSFFDRFLVLNWSRLTPDQQSHVSGLIGRGRTHPDIVQYRPFFEERPPEALDRSPAQPMRYEGVNLDEYYEDESGQPLDRIGLMQAVTGQEYPIILGDPASVLRLGPTAIRDRDTWTVSAANDIAHFLGVVRQIAASEWLASPLSLSYEAGDAGGRPPVSLTAPNLEATRGVLLLLRQLVSYDDVFNHACARYLAHVGDGRKGVWVQHEQRAFNAVRTSPLSIPVVPPEFRKRTGQQVVDLFMYGSGLVHRQSRDRIEPDFAKAVAEYGREHVVVAFNACCLDLCRHAFSVYHVIRQDFDHWLQAGCNKPDRIDVSSVLE